MAKPVDLIRSNRRFKQLKKRMQLLHDRIGTVPIYRDQLAKIMGDLSIAIDDDSWFAAMEAGGTVEQQARFSTIIAKIRVARDWIFNNFPKHADSAWRVSARDQYNNEIRLELTPAQLAVLKTNLADLLGES